MTEDGKPSGLKSPAQEQEEAYLAIRKAQDEKNKSFWDRMSDRFFEYLRKNAD
jgi:hypothetical protein